MKKWRITTALSSSKILFRQKIMNCINNFEEKYEIPYEENFQFKEEEKLDGGMAISTRNPIKFLGFFMLSCISMIILFGNMGF